MRIAKLKIGGRSFRVEPWKFEDATNDDARGDTIIRTGLIRIAEGYADDITAETVIHEALHVLIDRSSPVSSGSGRKRLSRPCLPAWPRSWSTTRTPCASS